MIGLLFSAISIAAEDEKVTLNFVNADIASVIMAVGEITGKNFILDPRVNGTVNIISARAVPRELAYQILLSALKLQGFTAVEGSGVTKIVPEADAKQNATPMADKGSRFEGDLIITQIYPLEFESAAQLLPILRPLIAPNNTIAVYPNGNTLVITDYASNIKRLSKIIQSIDQPSIGELVTLRLLYASAVDMAELLTKLIPEAGGPPGAPAAQRFSVAANGHTNSLILRTDNPAYLSRAKALIESLDIPATGAGAIHVVYLRNADAVAIAEILRGIFIADQKGLLTRGAPSGAQPTPHPAPIAPTSQAPPPPGSPASIAAGTTPNVPFPPPALGSGGPGLIQADPATNSLIIAAPDAVYNTLGGIIEQLDTRRTQVHLEALIAEVSATKAAEFGIQFQAISNLDEAGVFGVTNFRTTPGSNIIENAVNPLAAAPGLNVGVVRGRITIGGVELVNLRLLARALEGDADSNVLSAPNILTLDNEEAKIVIGQNVPFVTGSFAQASGTGGAANPFQTIERRDVGLTLRIKPQIAEGGLVNLKIFQEVSSIAAQPPSSRGSDIITNKRSVESTVLVDDGQIAVLGGLIQNDVRNNIDKVPVLGDIPVVGNLFRYESRRRTKTNLMVFLRPVVLPDSTSLEAITSDRYNYIRNQQGKAQAKPHFVLPEIKTPQLPSLPAEAPEAVTPPGEAPAHPHPQ